MQPQEPLNSLRYIKSFPQLGVPVLAVGSSGLLKSQRTSASNCSSASSEKSSIGSAANVTSFLLAVRVEADCDEEALEEGRRFQNSYIVH
jgi:hypothetical protein